MTSLRKNSSAVRANMRCSSLISSGVKMSSGVRSAVRNSPPFIVLVASALLVMIASCWRLEDNTPRVRGSTRSRRLSVERSAFELSETCAQLIGHAHRFERFGIDADVKRLRRADQALFALHI